jgi:chromosomal replication initiation ATPase DnaA
MEDFRAHADSLNSLLPDDLSPSLVLAITPPNISDILRTVARFYGVKPEAALYAGTGEHGPRLCSHVRQVTCCLARRMTRASHQKIANALGYRNHTTVHYNALLIEGRAQRHELLRDDLDILRRRITDHVLDRCEGVTWQ